MKRIGKNILAWAKRYERHLSTVFFIGGFVGDVITYLLVPVTWANYIFLGNLILAAICTVGSHTLESHFPDKTRRLARFAHFIFPLGAQFFIGGLLSGFLIFYTKSAVLFVSWPFLLLLLVIFLGNEVFRDYRAHLAFQTVLFFFSIYAYLIFAVPLYAHALTAHEFLESTALSVAAFAAFLGLLAALGWRRLMRTLWMIVSGSLLLVALVVGSYYSGIVPPIPLTLQQGGVYHGLTLNPSGTYAVLAEGRRWFQPGGQIVHHVPGTPLYVFSSVFAPRDFSLQVTHVWEWYDPQAKQWVTEARITFPVKGGRGSGYRGYSEKDFIAPGRWVVSVETQSGQVIGRIRFTVLETQTPPRVHTEVK